MNATTENGSRASWLAVPVAVLIVAFGLWSFTRRPATRAAGGSSPAIAVDPSLAAIAVQPGDLPAGYRRCSFSGDMATHLRKMKAAASADTYEELVRVWNQLQEHGAVAGYAAYWGDSAEACDGVVDPLVGARPHGPGIKHPTTVFSVVVRFDSAAAAASAYQADIFSQSTLKSAPNYVVSEGASTGLGPSSIVATTAQATVPVEEAAWQSASVNVLYGSENLPLPASKAVTDAVNRRIR